MVGINNDFERNFLAQVRGYTPVDGDLQPSVPSEKKLLSKRLILVMILAVALVVLLAVLLTVRAIIHANPAAKASISSAVVGYWACADGTEIIFNADGTYMWYPDSEVYAYESGEFEHTSSTLTVIPTFSEVDGDVGDSERERTTFSLSARDNILTLINRLDNMTYRCTEVENE